MSGTTPARVVSPLSSGSHGAFGDGSTRSSSSSSPRYDLMYTLRGHQRSVSSVSFSPDGLLLASCGGDKLVKLWSLATGLPVATLSGAAQGLNDVSWSSDSTYLAAASDDKSLYVWNVETHRRVRTLRGHTSYVLCLSYNAQSTLIASGSFDETVRLWDVQRGQCHRTIAAHSEAVSGVGFNREGTLLVSCSYDGSIRLWDVATGQCLKTLEHQDKAPLSCVGFSPSSMQVLATSRDSTVRLWDVPNGKIVKSYTRLSCAKFPVRARLTSPVWREKEGGGREEKPRVYVACGSEDHNVYLWDLQTKMVVQTLEGHRDTVIDVAIHPSEPIIASASLEHDCSIKVWLDES